MRKRLRPLKYQVEIPRQSTGLADTIYDMYKLASSRSEVTGVPSTARFTGKVTINGEDIEVVLSVNSQLTKEER